MILDLKAHQGSSTAQGPKIIAQETSDRAADLAFARHAALVMLQRTMLSLDLHNIKISAIEVELTIAAMIGDPTPGIERDTMLDTLTVLKWIPPPQSKIQAVPLALVKP